MEDINGWSTPPACRTASIDQYREDSVTILSMWISVAVLPCVVTRSLLDAVFFLRLRLCQVPFKEDFIVS